ncbi:XRE family transcriptional regulator [Maritalea porphyrae]|uniref:XRE family transcriptional regulator n=1 Tax=Maritalea porphyrae TaxID=880732 RepID=UPI0022AE7F2D|nr:helix-turn-helix transcriptional regulator [Maritalea porphyrae]MCZ4270764.1 helix-turn-helix transcriptional regulator [Maritalea porphyrae]
MKAMESIGSRITHLRENILKLTQEQFAERLRVSRGAVGNWERNKPIGRKSIEIISSTFDTSVDWLITGQGLPPSGQSNILSQLEPPSNATIVGSVETTPTIKIPLYGHAVGGADGEFVLNGNKLDDISAPPVLSGIRGAYAVTVAGDSMEPRYEDGETLFIDPQKRVSKGDYVVAQIQTEEDGPICAYIKKFVRHNSAELILEQFNPTKQLQFDHDHVVSVDYVVMGGRLF